MLFTVSHVIILFFKLNYIMWFGSFVWTILGCFVYFVARDVTKIIVA